MMLRGAVLAWLTAVWVALWGELSAANVAGGLLAGTVAVSVLPRRQGEPGRIRVRPLRLLRFAAYFVAKLVQANVVVAWEVITPQSWRLNEGIVAVPLRSARGGTVAILAGAITLTPGTLVVDAALNPPVLYVHVLQLRDPAAVRTGILRLEWLLTRAIEQTVPGRDGEGER